jgi:hypothetical protein
MPRTVNSQSFFEDSLSSKSSQKRNADQMDNNHLNQQNKKKFKNPLDLKERIGILDPDNNTCIGHYIDYYEHDPLVREYVDLLFKSPILPTIPDTKLIDKWLDLNPKCGLTKITKTDSINDFGYYFQSRYFEFHVKEANNEAVALFNPKIYFNIPQFQLMPLKSLDFFNQSKETFVLAYQSEAVSGSEFAIQLRLLRIITRITNDITSEASRLVVDVEERKNTILYHFSRLYTIARLAFIKKFKLKKINWSERTSKCRQTLPQWRKTDEDNPPKTNNNKFMAEACKQVQDNIEITGSQARENFQNWQKTEKTEDEPSQQPRTSKYRKRKRHTKTTDDPEPSQNIVSASTSSNSQRKSHPYKTRVNNRNQSKSTDQKMSKDDVHQSIF